MYWFGKEVQSDEWQQPDNWSGISLAKKSFALTSLEEIITILDGF